MGGSGAVELRPLGVGEVLDTAIKLYTRNAATMWKIVGAVIVPVVVIEQLIIAASLPSGAYVSGGKLYTPTGTLSTPAAGSLAEVILGLLAALVVNGALVLCLADTYVGRPLDWRRSLQASTRRLGPLLVLAIVTGILTTIGFILVIAPGLWLLVSWTVAVPALMFEQLGPIQAMRRSWRLVRKRWWATFGALLVSLILLFVVLLVVGLIVGGIESGLKVSSIGAWVVLSGLSTIIIDLVAFPFIGSVIAVIYIDLRVRKEALDLELLSGSLGQGSDGAAAGDVPQPGSPLAE